MKKLIPVKTKKYFRQQLLAMPLLLISFSVFSQDAENARVDAEKNDDAITKLRTLLHIKMPNLKIEKIEESPIKGFYQIFYNSTLLYISANGQYLIDGDVYDTNNGFNNIKKATVNGQYAPMRVSELAKLPKESFITFKAKEQKHSVTVFTDVDCGYCRKLHNEIGAMNDLGITVNYLAFPRAGKGSSTYNRMASIWCSKDQQDAMTKEKSGIRIEEVKCDDHPLDTHMELVRKFGLTGTPAIVTESGKLIPGYVPSDKLLGELAQDN